MEAVEAMEDVVQDKKGWVVVVMETTQDIKKSITNYIYYIGSIKMQ